MKTYSFGAKAAERGNMKFRPERQTPHTAPILLAPGTMQLFNVSPLDA
jgi:hypothetical protein